MINLSILNLFKKRKIVDDYYSKLNKLIWKCQKKMGYLKIETQLWEFLSY